MGARLKDPRHHADVTLDRASLTLTSVLLAAQGWRDYYDDLRQNPAFRLTTRTSMALLTGLDVCGIDHVLRMRANPVLDRLPEPLIKRPEGAQACLPAHVASRAALPGRELELNAS